ncbi:MAG: lipocalin-like domain-containing protein [Gemmatimonadota bacterium]|nr:MAG: lipocalin-like domain-containing protein [Gemmatimonadota bacterium]
MRHLPVAVVLVISASLPADGAEQEEDFVGTWGLERIEQRNDAGQWTQSSSRLGPPTVGYLMYDSGGNMAVQIMRGDRPRFASDVADEVTSDEAKPALQGYVAYFGTYSVDEDEGSVTHHRIGNIVPNLVGVDAKRFYMLQDERLTLTIPSGDVRLIWRRLN